MTHPSATLNSATDEDEAERNDSLVATVREMVTEQWEHRELLWQMTVRDLKLRYKQAVMGIGWAVLMPLLIVGAGVMVKMAMAHATGQPLDRTGLAGMALKSLPWAFFVGTLSFATGSLTANLNLVTKIYFPREVFPLSSLLTQLIDSAVGTTAITLAFLLMGTGISWSFLWLLPLTLSLLLFTAGAALLASCANLFFRDVKYIVQVLLTFGIFFVPVFYDPEALGPRGGALVLLNPLAILIEGYRVCVIEHRGLLENVGAWQAWHFPYATAVSVLLFCLSWLMFHRLEFLYAERI